MTTTELIDLLKKYEFGASERPREITISKKDNEGKLIPFFTETEKLIFNSSGDGVAGAELGIVIQNKT